ncbi:MAG: sulfurtransferase [Halorhabdus sp.]
MPDIFVSPEWVATNDQDIAIVDVRREGAYEGGHVPGAVHIPFEQFRDPTDEMEGKLPTAEDFAALLGEVGIAPDDRIVAYDDDHGVYASRFLVTAEVFGHDIDRLHLLDGDIEVWARIQETTAAVPETTTTDYSCQRRTDGPLVSAAELEDALGGDAVIVDTRDPVEYDTVHLPGAVNFQWRDLVDDETRQLKPRQEREHLLKAHGMTRDRPIRLYCNTARRLSFLYAVLREMGYEDVAFYEGGIDAWVDYGGPVETTPS